MTHGSTLVATLQRFERDRTALDKRSADDQHSRHHGAKKIACRRAGWARRRYDATLHASIPDCQAVWWSTPPWCAEADFEDDELGNEVVLDDEEIDYAEMSAQHPARYRVQPKAAPLKYLLV